MSGAMPWPPVPSAWADRGIFEHSPDSNKIAAPAGPAGENVGTAEWDATGGDAQAWTYFMGDIVEGWHDEVRMRPSSPVQPSTEAGVSPRVVGEMLRERRLHDGDRNSSTCWRILRRGGPLHLHGLERSARRLFRGMVRWLGCDRASSGSVYMGCGLGVTKGTSRWRSFWSAGTRCYRRAALGAHACVPMHLASCLRRENAALGRRATRSQLTRRTTGWKRTLSSK